MTSIGPGGYPDGQRVANWDGPTLWSETTTPTNAAVASPVVNVSRYGYLAGFMDEFLSQSQVEISWFADRNAAISINRRQFVLTSQILHVASLRVPNLGPYAQVQVSAIGGVNYDFATLLFATNRTHPLELIPQSPVLIDQQNQAIAANATNTYYPSDYYAGPVSVWADVSQGPALVTLQYLTTAGSWDMIDQRTIAAAGEQPFQMVTPAGAWRMQVTNQAAAAGAVFLAATPSLTGST